MRSFGTEDRETQYPVPAQSQVYDYILFRGSDIKDIRVVTNATTHAPLNDPAIMQLSVPQQPQFQSHSVLGQMGAQMNQFGGGPYANMGGIGGLNANLATSLGGGMQQRDPRTLTTNKPSELIVSGAEPPSVLSPAVVEPSGRSNHEQHGKKRYICWSSLVASFDHELFCCC